MQLAELTVRGFADLLGSDAPAPGGRAGPPAWRRAAGRGAADRGGPPRLGAKKNPK